MCEVQFYDTTVKSFSRPFLHRGHILCRGTSKGREIIHQTIMIDNDKKNISLTCYSKANADTVGAGPEPDWVWITAVYFGRWQRTICSVISVGHKSSEAPEPLNWHIYVQTAATTRNYLIFHERVKRKNARAKADRF